MAVDARAECAPAGIPQGGVRSADEVAIRIRGLSKCYHIYSKPRDRLLQMLARGRKRFYSEFWALKDVSFDVGRGETVGIVGRNGSGKSTLLQMICGTLTPTGGTVSLDGRIAALLELGSGFNPEFTGRENVYMNASILGLSKDEIDVRFDDIAAFADIGGFIDQPVKTYSSGMMVRLAFSVSINIDPQILVVDEALSVGDELFQRKCFSRIEQIRENGATILFVSHSGSAVVELCDRAVLLDSGEKLAVGLPKDIIGHYHKLLYAPEHKRAALRAELQRGFGAGGHGQAGGANEAPGASSVHGGHTGEDANEAFDPNLKPATTVDYESHGAKIRDPFIRTLTGDPVNNLERGRRYKYTYRVEFERAASRVRFGMVIRTTSGLSLGGALSAAEGEAIPVVDKGSVVLVTFAFTCCLNPGIYFLNAGVFGSTAQEETVLHRLVDAVAFRVLPVPHNLATEVVDLSCTPSVKVDA